jgi:hypothetical protein
MTLMVIMVSLCMLSVVILGLTFFIVMLGVVINAERLYAEYCGAVLNGPCYKTFLSVIYEFS